jgi:hypothetical protein
MLLSSRLRSPLWLLLPILVLLGVSSCGDDGPENSGEPVLFVFELQGTAQPEPFVVTTSDADLIAQVRAELAKPLNERTRHPSGPIARGDGGHNWPWSWHFYPDEWSLVEVSMEVCDGTPADVENNIDYWVDTVEVFCPWSARVIEETNE